MKVATYNVEFLFGEGLHAHSGNAWVYTKEFVEARILHLAADISRIDADIMFIQELGTEDVLGRILKKVDKGYSYFIAAPDKNGIGNAVIYKSKDCICSSIPARADMPVFVEGDRDGLGGRIWSRRDFIQVTTSYDGKPMHLIGLHLKSTFAMPEERADGTFLPMDTQALIADGLVRSEFFRLSQAKKVREVIDRFFAADPAAAVIVAGDFNAEERDIIGRLIRGAISSAPDSLVSAIERVPPERRFSSFKHGRKKLLDHIIFSKSLEGRVASFAIMNEDLKDSDEAVYSMSHVESDHPPLVLELR